MSKKISVLLLENIADLGDAGSIVTVSEGYARNFLFPRGQAALADKKTTTRFEAVKKADRNQAAAELAELQALAEKLSETELQMTAKVKDGDEIYGSIGAREIVKELNQQARLKLKPSAIVLPARITRLGAHEVILNISPEVSTNLIVVVEALPD